MSYQGETLGQEYLNLYPTVERSSLHPTPIVTRYDHGTLNRKPSQTSSPGAADQRGGDSHKQTTEQVGNLPGSIACASTGADRLPRSGSLDI